MGMIKGFITYGSVKAFLRAVLIIAVVLLCLTSVDEIVTASNQGWSIIQGWNGTKHREITIDEATRAVNFIDYAHHEVHGGSSYHVTYSVASLGAMTSPDDTIQLHFTTPNTTKWLHMIVHARSGGESNYVITEAPTGGMTSPTGTLTAYNKNRNSSKTSGITVSYDGALATGGAEIHNEYIGQGNKASAGESRGTQEFVLKQNTAYAIKMTDTTAITATLILDWYEHTDKEP